MDEIINIKTSNGWMIIKPAALCGCVGKKGDIAEYGKPIRKKILYPTSRFRKMARLILQETLGAWDPEIDGDEEFKKADEAFSNAENKTVKKVWADEKQKYFASQGW